MVAGMSARSGGGVVQAIYLSPARKIPMKSVYSVHAESGMGLVGDRYHGTKHRHVSVQSFEDLTEAAAVFEAPINHDLTRRNITLSGFEIPTSPGNRIWINGVLLEVVRIAAPCKLLDDDIGVGARTALRRRAGTIFRLLRSGSISVGDSVERAVTDGHK
jgi:MOSC domain-containing protein YiiM|tara:strand:- start:106 stop:585 length:480 start_codon:yes stop_codon:yes gene_type:complete